MCVMTVDQMVERNVGLAKKWAANCARGGNQRFADDLHQEAMIGLWRATKKFDHSRGVKFSTYATWYIKSSVLRWIQDCSRLIRLPVNRWDSKSRPEHADAITDAELAISLHPVEDYRGDEALKMQDLGTALDRLHPRMAMVLRARFGVGGEPQTAKAIGVKMGISLQRVFQIQHEALRELAVIAPELREWI